MKYTLYENPVTRKFALLRLPHLFVEGDALPIASTEQWFDSREQAVVGLRQLLDREDDAEA